VEPVASEWLHFLSKPQRHPRRSVVWTAYSGIVFATVTPKAEPVSASQTSLSTRQLQSQLSKLGTNYTSELRFLRTEAACRILSEHDVEIAAVDEAVGIPTASVFSRAFKLWTGLSPRQYRKEICLINDKR
jgi:methylphosphotriester-DNA--protein-cysteine methyltransferase